MNRPDSLERLIYSVTEIAKHHIDVEYMPAIDDPSTDLSMIGFDSLKKVMLMLDIERNFSIKFPSNMIDAEIFRSLQNIAKAIYSLLSFPDQPE